MVVNPNAQEPNHLTVRLSAGFNAEVMLAGLLALTDQTTGTATAALRALFPTLEEAMGGTLSVTLTPCAISEIHGWRATVAFEAHHDHEHDHEGEHVHGHTHEHTSLADIFNFYDQYAKLTDAALDRVEKIWLTLAKAESSVHGADVSTVHFHEVGRLSNRLAIALIATFMDRLGLTLSASPIPVGDGVIRCAHGFVANPAPATMAMLPGLPVTPFKGDGEPITPTGLAILIGLGASFGPWPEMQVARQVVAYARQYFPGVPNGARFILGTK